MTSFLARGMVALLLGLSLGATGCHPLGGCIGKLDQAAVVPSQSCLQLDVTVCNAFSPDVDVQVQNTCSNSLVIEDDYLWGANDGGTTEIAAGATTSITLGEKGVTRDGGKYHYAIPAKLGSTDVTLTVDAEQTD